MEMCQAPGDSGVIGRDILQYRETAQLSSTVMSQLISFTREDNFRGSAADAFAELAGRQGANLYSVATKLETVADALYSYNESLVYWQGMIESVLRDFASTEAEIQKAHHKQDEVAAQYPGLVGVALHAIAGYAAWHRQAEELVSLSQTLTNKYVQFAVEIAAAALIAANKIDAVSTFEPLDVVVDLWTFATNREHEFEHWLDENTNAILAVLDVVDKVLVLAQIVCLVLAPVTGGASLAAAAVVAGLGVASSLAQFALTTRASGRGLKKDSGETYDVADDVAAGFGVAISIAGVIPALKAAKFIPVKDGLKVSKSIGLGDGISLGEHPWRFLGEVLKPVRDAAELEVMKLLYGIPYVHVSFNNLGPSLAKLVPEAVGRVPAVVSVLAA
jgi:hypothetical protein